MPRPFTFPLQLSPPPRPAPSRSPSRPLEAASAAYLRSLGTCGKGSCARSDETGSEKRVDWTFDWILDFRSLFQNLTPVLTIFINISPHEGGN